MLWIDHKSNIMAWHYSDESKISSIFLKVQDSTVFFFFMRAGAFDLWPAWLTFLLTMDNGRRHTHTYQELGKMLIQAG